MDTRLFSQIPGPVLKKFKPETRAQQRKVVKFIDSDSSDDVDVEVTSSLSDSTESLDSSQTEPCKQPQILPPAKTPKSIIKTPRETVSATEICKQSSLLLPTKGPKSNTRTTPRDNASATKITNESHTIETQSSEGKSDAIVQTDPAPCLVSKETQTTDSFVTDSVYHEFKTHLQSQSLSSSKPMYSLSKNKSEPPLKIGLSLPKGRKRKVFYPDDSDDE